MRTNADTYCMTAVLIIASLAAFFGLSSKYGAESRRGFDEKSPLA